MVPVQGSNRGKLNPPVGGWIMTDEILGVSRPSPHIPRAPGPRHEPITTPRMNLSIGEATRQRRRKASPARVLLTRSNVYSNFS